MARRDYHPSWCGRGHVCSADRPGGEHRSNPETFDTRLARLVLTRILTVAGRNRVEIRTVVDLPADPATARNLFEVVTRRLCQAIRPVGANGGA